jgi:hypothetical protein
MVLGGEKSDNPQDFRKSVIACNTVPQLFLYVKQKIVKVCVATGEVETIVLTIVRCEVRILIVALPVRFCKKQPINVWLTEVLGKKRSR